MLKVAKDRVELDMHALKPTLFAGARLLSTTLHFGSSPFYCLFLSVAGDETALWAQFWSLELN